jgi:phosphatidylglycerol:prolipoprotein diacylglycerol transferase
VYPVLFSLGPFTVYSFGVMMAAGFYFGSMAAVSEFRRRGGDGDKMWNYLVWVFVAGLLGSRLLSLTNDLAALARNPLQALLSGAGFVWYGGLIAGAAVAWLLAKRYRFDFITVLECCAPALALGQALGRVGCHVAGDGDWGKVTTVSWGVAYEKAIIGWPHAPGVLVHPTPLYEFAGYMAVFGVLWGLRRRDLPRGTMFALYCVLAGSVRFGVEFLRVNPLVGLGLTQAQFIAAAMVTGGLAWLFWRRGALLRGLAAPAAVVVLALGLLALPACNSRTGLSRGQKAPDFMLSRPDGAVRKLSGYRGSTVLLNLWATWCPPCIEEMPLLNELAVDYKDRGLRVVGLAGDDDPARVKEFLERNPLDFEILLDPDGQVGTLYGITGYPETFLIDREGRVQGKYIGPLPAEGGRPSAELRKRIETLLGG